MKNNSHRFAIHAAGALLCTLAAVSLPGKNKAASGAAVPDQQTLQRIETVAKRGLFQPNWKSLENYKIPAWYQDAKFGIFIDDWLLRTSELVDKYQPQVIWFDWWIAQPAFHPYLQTFSAYYYNRGAEWKKGVAINYKKHGGESFPDTAGVLDIERGQLANKRDLFWQTDTSVSTNSWGYIKDHKYRTANSLIDDLIDIVSKNGCLLLNIGPKPDGTISEPEVKLLEEMGQWLAVNGEAIYGTRPWKVFGEGATKVDEGPFAETKRKDFTGEDIRFTTRGNTLYAIALDWPKGATLTIKSLPTGSAQPIKRIKLLGAQDDLKWSHSRDGLTITLPAQPVGQHAYTFKIAAK